jgi:hypothetical protein
MLIEKKVQTNKIQTAPRLTDAQLVLLTAAARREDRLMLMSEEASAAARRTIGVLLRRGLFEEVSVVADQPNWRSDEDGRTVGAMITQAGLAALGILAVEAMEDAQEDPETKPGVSRGQDLDGRAQDHSRKPRTKRALIIGLLQRNGGASLDELIAATGWLPHTTRAALTGLRQKGFVLDKSLGVDRKPTYRIAGARPDAADSEVGRADSEVRSDGHCEDTAAAATDARQAA